MIDPTLLTSFQEIPVGTEFHRLTIGELVRNVRNHPLFADTKIGYIRAGRLRECICSCGQMKLISEVMLRTGRIKSCGCLRNEILQNSNRNLKTIRDCKAERKVLCAYLRTKQSALKYLQLRPVEIRDEEAIKKCAEEIRNAYIRKRELTRLISRK